MGVTKKQLGHRWPVTAMAVNGKLLSLTVVCPSPSAACHHSVTGSQCQVQHTNDTRTIITECFSFLRLTGLAHLTRSPHHPQGNGETGGAVQTVQNVLKTAEDPHIALLNYRATPLQQGLYC